MIFCFEWCWLWLTETLLKFSSILSPNVWYYIINFRFSVVAVSISARIVCFISCSLNLNVSVQSVLCKMVMTFSGPFSVMACIFLHFLLLKNVPQFSPFSFWNPNWLNFLTLLFCLFHLLLFLFYVLIYFFKFYCPFMNFGFLPLKKNLRARYHVTYSILIDSYSCF